MLNLFSLLGLSLGLALKIWLINKTFAKLQLLDFGYA
jgi:hypothetical protein